MRNKREINKLLRTAPWPEKTLDIQNKNGRKFRAKIIRKGDQYGKDNCLTHDGDKPLVEFWDLTYQNNKFGPDGQFVSRYYVETILEVVNGLCLQGDVPEWNIDAEPMTQVVKWVREAK